MSHDKATLNARIFPLFANNAKIFCFCVFLYLSRANQRFGLAKARCFLSASVMYVQLALKRSNFARNS